MPRLIERPTQIEAAGTPPKITVQWGERADGAPGAPLRVYRLVAE